MGKKWWEHLEVFVDEVIPFLLIILLGIIIIEFFFHELALKYHALISIADWIILAFFVIDLIFKYYRVKVLPIFLKKYWLDILAIFPFFLVFRVFEEVARVLGEVRELPLQLQKVVHVGLEVKEVRLAEEAARATREVKEISGLTRTERFVRFLNPIEKIPRAVKAIPFYEDPKHKHELKAHLKSIEKEVKAGEAFVEKEISKGERFAEKEVRTGERFVERKGKKLFKEVEREVEYEFRGSRRTKNKRKGVSRKVRSVVRQKRLRA